MRHLIITLINAYLSAYDIRQCRKFVILNNFKRIKYILIFFS